MNQQQFADAVADRLKRAGDDATADWYLALLHAALDESPGDLQAALEEADRAFKDNPNPPDDEPLTDEDVDYVSELAGEGE